MYWLRFDIELRLKHGLHCLSYISILADNLTLGQLFIQGGRSKSSHPAQQSTISICFTSTNIATNATRRMSVPNILHLQRETPLLTLNHIAFALRESVVVVSWWDGQVGWDDGIGRVFEVGNDIALQYLGDDAFVEDDGEGCLQMAVNALLGLFYSRLSKSIHRQ